MAHDITLPMGLTVDEVEIRAADLSWNTKLSLNEPAIAIVRLSASHLESFVAAQLPPMVQKLQLKFADGLIHATASVKIVFEVTATAYLKPEIEDGKTLSLKVVGFDGPSVARGMLEQQVDQRNPIFDASSLPFKIELESVNVAEMLTLKGRVLAV